MSITVRPFPAVPAGLLDPAYPLVWAFGGVDLRAVDPARDSRHDIRGAIWASDLNVTYQTRMQARGKHTDEALAGLVAYVAGARPVPSEMLALLTLVTVSREDALFEEARQRVELGKPALIVVPALILSSTVTKTAIMGTSFEDQVSPDLILTAVVQGLVDKSVEANLVGPQADLGAA